MAETEFTIEELQSEEWRPVVGFETDYYVSNLGRVKRVSAGLKNVATTYPGRLLKPTVWSNGYLFVSLWSGTKRLKTSVHCLVSAAFIGPRPHGIQINHKDGKKINNRLTNLEYVTPKENARHALQTGLSPMGKNHWTQKHPEWLEDRRGQNHWVHKMPERKARLFGGKKPAPESRQGSKNGFAKLTEQDVRTIRAAYNPPQVTQQTLADRFGVRINTINAIIKRRNWAWLD